MTQTFKEYLSMAALATMILLISANNPESSSAIAGPVDHLFNQGDK